MAKTAVTPDNYDDQRTHLAKQPYDILTGWALVCCLALGIVLGFWHYPPLGFGPESPIAEAVTLDAVGLPLVHHEGAALADDLGMTRERAE
jgi:hypothetical protein